MIPSQLEILEQGIRYLTSITDQQYQSIVRPHFSSSAGAHFRHILDHYLALKNMTDGVVDYNVRHRYCQIETDRLAAIQASQELMQWLQGLPLGQMKQPVTVISEISVSEAKSCASPSSFGRELIFVSSHAVHHFAILKIIASLQGAILESNLGLAPATASFQRQQAG